MKFLRFFFFFWSQTFWLENFLARIQTKAQPTKMKLSVGFPININTHTPNLRLLDEFPPKITIVLKGFPNEIVICAWKSENVCLSSWGPRPSAKVLMARRRRCSIRFVRATGAAATQEDAKPAIRSDPAQPAQIQDPGQENLQPESLAQKKQKKYI